MAASHTHDELEKFARRHVCYEVWATANGAARWYIGRGTLSQGTSAQLIVAQLVHLRALDDFLCLKPTRNDDVSAEHYLEGWDRPESHLGEHRDWINSQVAHLTMRRRPTPRWNPLELTAGVIAGFQTFLNELRRADGAVGPFEQADVVSAAFLRWYYSLAMRAIQADSEAEAEELEPLNHDLSNFEFGWASPESTAS